MGFAEWFGGGSAALKKRVDELEASLAKAKDDSEKAVAAARKGSADEVKKLEKKLSEKESALQEAREAKARVEKKVEKTQGSKDANAERIAKLDRKVAELTAEAVESRNDLLAARRELDDALAARAEVEKQLASRAPAASVERSREAAPAADTPTTAQVEAPAPRPRRAFEDTDERVSRLEERLAEARVERDALREKLVKAERDARDADERRRNDKQRADNALRELQHNLQAERKAYRILQLQFEAQVDTLKGFEQQFNERIDGAVSAAVEQAVAEARAKVAAEAPAPAPAPEAAPSAAVSPAAGLSQLGLPPRATGPLPSLAPRTTGPLPTLTPPGDTSPLKGGLGLGLKSLTPSPGGTLGWASGGAIGTPKLGLGLKTGITASPTAAAPEKTDNDASDGDKAPESGNPA